MEYFDPEERAREKQRARDEDVRAFKAGGITAEELPRKNAHFAFSKDQAHLVLTRRPARMK